MRDVQVKYLAAEGRKEKGRILGEVCENLDWHRKHAIRKLNGPAPSGERPSRLRDPLYPERLIRVLEAIWEASQHLWSERLKEALPLWLPWAQKPWSLSAKEMELLLSMSSRTMDRRLAPYKLKLSRRIYGKTKPGRYLRQHIPIQTESWELREPGWVEADTVSHSGGSGLGLFAYTVNETDLFSEWVESRAVLGKRAMLVTASLDEMRRAMPFLLLGIDSDNGEEFINWFLDYYCRAAGIKRFRSRPYKKDDQAHVEQKNWTHVRRLIGWDRYDTREAVAAMNDLYRNEWRLLNNLYLPSVKLVNKIRVGSRLKRVHDTAKTPLDRLLESGQGNRAQLDELRKLRERIDPFQLARAVGKKLDRVWSLASRVPAQPERGAAPVRRRSFDPYVVDNGGTGPAIEFGSDPAITRLCKHWYRDRLFQTQS
jgi:hypothetical protein